MLDANARFTRCIAIVCGPAIEGGFVNDKLDPGGATNHGITLATLAHWRGAPCTVADIQDLQLSEATTIYRALYWNVVGGDSLPPGLDLMAFDCAVNEGPGTSAMMLQEAVGAVPDGHVGPNTIKAVVAEDPLQAIHAFSVERMDAYRRLPGWAHDGKGWTARVKTITAQAQAWASGG